MYVAMDFLVFIAFTPPPTHKPYLSLLTIRKASPLTSLWLLLDCAYPRRNGQAELAGAYATVVSIFTVLGCLNGLWPSAVLASFLQLQVTDLCIAAVVLLKSLDLTSCLSGYKFVLWRFSLF